MNHLAKLAHLLPKGLRLIGKPLYREALWKGVAATVEHAPAFESQRFDVVVDVGACFGQFAAFAGERWRQADIHCFEPLPSAWTKLERITKMLGANLHPVAIGPKDSLVDMNVSRRDDSSSLLPIGPLQDEIFPGTARIDTIQVWQNKLCSRLNPSDLKGRALLKIDVQGYELEVLKGCEDLLGCFHCIYVECSWKELYEGQALYEEVQKWLDARGFNEAGMFNEERRGRELVQADVLFLRKR